MSKKIQKAIAAIELGDKSTAYRLLVDVIKSDPKDKDAESAWLWMSTLVNTRQKKRECLETVLALNPNNVMAKERLADLDSYVRARDNLDKSHEVSEVINHVDQTQKKDEIHKEKHIPSIVVAIFLIVVLSFFGVAMIVGIALLTGLQDDDQGSGSQGADRNNSTRSLQAPTLTARSIQANTPPHQLVKPLVDVDQNNDLSFTQSDLDIIFLKKYGDYISRNFEMPATCKKMIFWWYIKNDRMLSISLVNANTGRKNFIDLGFHSGEASDLVKEGVYYIEVDGAGILDDWKISAHCEDYSWYE